MKRLRVSALILITILILSNSLKANPIGANFFSELVFDTTGWKLEMNLNMNTMEGDSLSLKGWYLVCGKDTAYFKDWQYLKAPQYHGSENTNYLVLTKDSLNGLLNLDIRGETLLLYSPDKLQRDNFTYGMHPLKLNQSICHTYDDNYYLDNSPTIGSENDSNGATGIIKGFVKDAGDNPAANYSYTVRSPGWAFYKTDSTGHFQFEWLSRDYSFSFLHEGGGKRFDVFFEPGDTLNLEFKLDWLTDVPKKRAIIVKDNSLAQNYPNPFNPLTSISYSIAKSGHVTLKVYNLLGNEISTIVNEFKIAGVHKATFDASTLPSGVYIYILQSGDFRSAKKMTVLK
ncbi:MAG TPA: T9SS type A sorting domain-containing protein [Ignavibacteriales bacterium]|nr:T9SS type A sorting domain-containing protein [Ignavibacteriales bacterium]